MGWKQSAVLPGNGLYDYQVVGESFYQQAFRSLCGERCEEGYEVECVALLLPEDDNPHDADAVAIYVNDKKVGHLPREEAGLYRLLMELMLPNTLGLCAAKIVGGWCRAGSEGNFGIKLDLDTSKITEATDITPI